MNKIEELYIGKTLAQGILVKAPGGEGHPNMIVITCSKGYLMCGYLNMEAAENFGDAAVLVGGATFEEVLHNPIKAATTAAKKAGVRDNMTGAQAAEVLNG